MFYLQFLPDNGRYQDATNEELMVYSNDEDSQNLTSDIQLQKIKIT